MIYSSKDCFCFRLFGDPNVPPVKKDLQDAWQMELIKSKTALMEASDSSSEERMFTLSSPPRPGLSLSRREPSRWRRRKSSLKLQVCRQVINSSNENIIKLDTKMANWNRIFEKGRCEIPEQQHQTGFLLTTVHEH